MAISTVAMSGLTTFDKFHRTGAGNTPATGVFVMAGNNSSVSNYATSADGITWTLRSGTHMGQSWGLYKIGPTFVNVAGGAANVVSTVMDPVNGPVTTGGTRLATATVDASGTDGVVYTNNGWAMWDVWGWHAYSIATAEKFPAGLSYTGATSAVTSPHRVVFDNGIFVCSGSNGIATSTDAITWTQRSSAGDFRFSRIMYAGGLWFAGLSGGAFYTSPDAITWTARTSMAGAYLVGATFGAGVWCVMTSAGSLFSSPDGVTWTSRTNPVTGTNWTTDLSAQGSSVLAFG